jgi:hypothetical protein
LQSTGIAPEELLILLKELGFYEVHILFWKTLEYRRIPEDNQYILNVAKKVSYVNLLCERAAF